MDYRADRQRTHNAINSLNPGPRSVPSGRRCRWRLAGFHCGLDGLSDALDGGLQVAVADMGVSQGHPGVGVSEHARDGGQGNAPGDGLAGDGVPEIVQADVVETGFLPRPAPEVQYVSESGLSGCLGDGNT